MRFGLARKVPSSIHSRMWQLRAPKYLYPLVVLVFGILISDTICGFVSQWMSYYFILRKKISKPKPDCDVEGGLKVIICGFPRSGSMTLQTAMDILGFPCFHGFNLCKPDGQSIRLLMKAHKSGKREDWDCLLKGYKGISDFPATTCYRSLIELYPDAKVILNIREASKWYKSFKETILKVSLLPCAKELLAEGMLKGKEEDMEFAMHMYNLHTQEVKAQVRPQSRLLVYEFGENTCRGWAPLCEFLQVEAPSLPFPHANDSQAFKNMVFHCKTIHSFVRATYFTLLAFIPFLVMTLLG